MTGAAGPRVVRFTKMHGAGNDVMIVDGIRQTLPEIAPLAPRWGDRHLGIGFDQLLVLRPGSEADFAMEIFNPDGSQVEMCANGLRCFFQYLRDEGHTQADEVTVETLSGIVRPRRAGEGLVTVDMGPPVLVPAKIPTALGDGGEGPVLDEPLDVEARPGEPAVTLEVTAVSMGNPHAVVFVDDVDATAVERLGPQVEHHPAFPNRTNVEFVALERRDRVRQRTWERGTGETLACGSGACATVVAGILRGALDPEVTVCLRGGELRIVWNGPGESVFMTGPAARIFDGTVEVE